MTFPGEETSRVSPYPERPLFAIVAGLSGKISPPVAFIDLRTVVLCQIGPLPPVELLRNIPSTRLRWQSQGYFPLFPAVCVFSRVSPNVTLIIYANRGIRGSIRHEIAVRRIVRPPLPRGNVLKNKHIQGIPKEADEYRTVSFWGAHI